MPVIMRLIWISRPCRIRILCWLRSNFWLVKCWARCLYRLIWVSGNYSRCLVLDTRRGRRIRHKWIGWLDI